LPKNCDYGIERDSLVDLRVMFSLHKSHYLDLLEARLGSMSPLFASQLGHMVGHMFNRIAVPGWSELNPDETEGEKAKSIFKEIKEVDNQLFNELRSKANDKCLFCDQKAFFFRRITVRFPELGNQNIPCVMCKKHIDQWDSSTLPEDEHFLKVLRKQIDKIEFHSET